MDEQRDQSQDGPDGHGLPLGWLLGDKWCGQDPWTKPRMEGVVGRAVCAALVSEVFSESSGMVP